MKTILIVVVILALVGTAGLSAAGHRLSYLKDQATAINSAESKREADAKNRITTLEAVQKDLTNESKRLQGECQKGLVAYTNLSASIKKNLAQPICTQ